MSLLFPNFKAFYNIHIILFTLINFYKFLIKHFQKFFQFSFSVDRLSFIFSLTPFTSFTFKASFCILRRLVLEFGDLKSLAGEQNCTFFTIKDLLFLFFTNNWVFTLFVWVIFTFYVVKGRNITDASIVFFSVGPIKDSSWHINFWLFLYLHSSSSLEHVKIDFNRQNNYIE